MDIATCLQRFENSFSSYTGDDPLDQWDKFVEYLEQRLPADSSDGMSLVFDSLVQKFINTEQYASDIRYINYCIKCASYHSDPFALYNYIYNKGIGTRMASLYVAWAQQFEHRGMNEQADAVYQRAMENQAQPADTVLNEYRQFQSRTKSQTQVPEAGARTPLRNSQLTNQMCSHREPVPQSKAPVECPPKPATQNVTIFVSRSENSGTKASSQTAEHKKTVSEYMTEELVCEGSELSFEEVRAEKYFRKLREKQEQAQKEHEEQVFEARGEGYEYIEELQENVQLMIQNLKETFYKQPTFKQRPAAEAATNLSLSPPQRPLERPPPSIGLNSRKSLGLRLHIEPSVASSEPNTASSLASFHPSSLPDRSVHHLPEPAAADQACVAQTSMVQAQLVQQPASFEHMNQSLHRLSVSRDDLCQTDGRQQSCSEDARPLEHNTTHENTRPPSEPEDNLNMSQGGTANLSHVTPNTSLGYIQATPSRVLPSPTVNTREALGVIMGMFQAPTLLEDQFGNVSGLHAAEREAEPTYTGSGDNPSLHKPAAAQFTIFQDGGDKENGGVAAPPSVQTSKPIRALAEIPVSNKPNDTPPDLMPDESTMWGARYNSQISLDACPNSTTDFAMLAQFVSTPFCRKTPVNDDFFPDQENNGDKAEVEAYLRRQTNKLSPILEQSPSNETLSETAVSRLAPASEQHGTIVGEGLHAAPSLCLTSSSITMVQPPPPAVLSFRDQTMCPTEASIPRTTGPSWEVYTSPEQPPKQDSVKQPESPVRRRSEAFTIMQDLNEPASPEQAQREVYDDPMSPESVLKPDWPPLRSPEVTAEPDLDVFLSPAPRRFTEHNKSRDIPMSPGTPCTDIPMSPMQLPHCADVPMSPMQPPRFSVEDEVMASPEKASAELQLVSDPWDDELISKLLSNLQSPLSAHPRCVTWQCNVPAISPNMTISMGNASLHINCVLGEGAFATVYQATDPRTSEKMVLKVQKPANAWEFYINTQLDARLRPDVRHLYSSLRSAHLFKNGSVLLGELHNYGTLLNTVNIYRTLSDKVMPQPLVMYFTVCLLHMVEKLHSISIVHADIKPDNILLGERFLENKCFDPENVDHGLALVDLGQSIDMTLFPQGTAFTGKCLTSGFQCTEMQSGRPWNYQTDYFGIAATVHCLLFGTYMKVTNEGGVWKTNGVFRRNPHSDLWLDFFHTLLNIPGCGALPCLRSLRFKVASVLQQSYSSKLPTLKSRLVVMLLESRKSTRR